MPLFIDAGQISSGYEAYVREFQKLYDFHSLTSGSPSDFLQLSPKLASSEGFRLDFSDLARTIRDREHGRLSAAEMLTIAGVAIGGPGVGAAEMDLCASSGTLQVLLAGVGGWSESGSGGSGATATGPKGSAAGRNGAAGAEGVRGHANDVLAEAGANGGPGAKTSASADQAGNGPGSGDQVPAEMGDILARLELANVQMRVYLDDIDRRMGRIEPHLGGRSTAAIPSGSSASSVPSGTVGTFGTSERPSSGMATPGGVTQGKRRRQEVAIASAMEMASSESEKFWTRPVETGAAPGRENVREVVRDHEQERVEAEPILPAPEEVSAREVEALAPRHGTIAEELSVPVVSEPVSDIVRSRKPLARSVARAELVPLTSPVASDADRAEMPPDHSLAAADHPRIEGAGPPPRVERSEVSPGLSPDVAARSAADESISEGHQRMSQGDRSPALGVVAGAGALALAGPAIVVRGPRRTSLEAASSPEGTTPKVPSPAVDLDDPTLVNVVRAGRTERSDPYKASARFEESESSEADGRFRGVAATRGSRRMGAVAALVLAAAALSGYLYRSGHMGASGTAAAAGRPADASAPGGTAEAAGTPTSTSAGNGTEAAGGGVTEPGTAVDGVAPGASAKVPEQRVTAASTPAGARATDTAGRGKPAAGEALAGQPASSALTPSRSNVAATGAPTGSQTGSQTAVDSRTPAAAAAPQNRVEGARAEDTIRPPRVEDLHLQSADHPPAVGAGAPVHVEPPVLLAKTPSAVAGRSPEGGGSGAPVPSGAAAASGAPVASGAPAGSGAAGAGGDIPRSTVSTPQLEASTAGGMVLYAPSPIYPQRARLFGIQGKVDIRATVDKKGFVRSMRVIDGPVLLQQSAQEAVLRRRYKPFILHGEATEFQTMVTINYRLM